MQSYKGDVINIEEILSTITLKHPLITAFGRDKNCLTNYIVFAERGATIHTPTLSMAVHCAFNLYYIFDIAYPRGNKNEMLFLEQVVYKLKPFMSISTTVTVVIDTISKI